MVDFERAREAMVDSQLRTANVTDWRLLTVFRSVPREIFVSEERRGLAYVDVDLPIGEGRFLSSAAPLARMLQLAEIDADDTVLDIGIGTGYSTAVIAGLAKSVTAVESSVALAGQARANLLALGVANANVVQGAPEAGAKAYGPFDVIMLEGAVSAVPEALFAQLAEGGRIVALVSSGSIQVAHVFVKAGRDVTARAEFDARLPPLTVPKPMDRFMF